MTTAASEKTSFAGLRMTEISSLWLALPPILAFALAGVIFEFSAFNLIGLSAELDSQLRSAATRDIALTLAESRARFLWSTSVLLFFFIAIALVIAAIVVMRQCLSRAGLRFYLAIGIGLCLAAGLHLIYGGATDSGTNAIFHFTFDSLTRSGQFDTFQLTVVQRVVFALNAGVVIAPCIALFAACATLTEGDRRQAGDLLVHLRAQMRRLKMLLNLGSALLVVGVLHMVVWLRWPAALITDPKVSAEIIGFSASLSMFWGAAFTLLIVAFYVPASYVLSRRAERGIAECPDKADGLDAREWLKRQGLSITPTQQLPQVAMMLAPLLAGPVGTALSSLSNPLAGG